MKPEEAVVPTMPMPGPVGHQPGNTLAGKKSDV